MIPRGEGGDLVVAACLDSNLIAIYDDALGEVVAVVSGIARPFGMVAGDRPGGGQRIYIAAFGSDSVDLVDIPDLARPEKAMLVARLKSPEVSR